MTPGHENSLPPVLRPREQSGRRRRLARQGLVALLSCLLGLGASVWAVLDAADQDLRRAPFAAILTGPITPAQAEQVQGWPGVTVLAGSLDVVPGPLSSDGRYVGAARVRIFGSVDAATAAWGLTRPMGMGTAAIGHEALLDQAIAQALGLQPGSTVTFSVANPQGERHTVVAQVLGTFSARSLLAGNVLVADPTGELQRFVRAGRSEAFSTLYVSGTAAEIARWTTMEFSSRIGVILRNEESLHRRVSWLGTAAFVGCAFAAALLVVLCHRQSEGTRLPLAIGSVLGVIPLALEQILVSGLSFRSWIVLVSLFGGLVLLSRSAGPSGAVSSGTRVRAVD